MRKTCRFWVLSPWFYFTLAVKGAEAKARTDAEYAEVPESAEKGNG